MMKQIFFLPVPKCYLRSVKNVVFFIAFIMLTKPFWPIVDYAINYEYIVNTLCENKEQPEKQCHGTCYLSEQLAKETETDKNPSSNKTSKTETPQLLIAELLPTFRFASEEFKGVIQLAGYQSDLFSSLFISKILHPPQLG